MGLEVLGHLRDLPVGQAGVRLAYVEVFLAVPDGEGVIGQHAAPLAVAPLDGGHDDIERAQGALHLEPLHAAPAGPVRRPGVLDHEALVPALARRGELGVEGGHERLAVVADLRGAREHERRVQRQRAQHRLPLGQRHVEQRTAIALEHVEDHERRGQLAEQLLGHDLPAEPVLEPGERDGPPLRVEREHLGVEDERPRQGEQWPDELGESCRHAVERPRVQLDPVALLVHLRADAVVLVLDDVRRREPPLDLDEVQDRGREHHPDRREVDEPRLVERAVPGLDGGHADVPAEHVRAPHGLTLAAERPGDRVLEQALAQPDPRLAAHHLHDVADLGRGRAGQERLEKLTFRRDAARRRDPVERFGDVAEGQRRRLRRSCRALGELGGHVPEVGVPLIRGRDVVAGRAAPGDHRVEEDAPADRQHPLVGPRERDPGVETRGDGQIGVLQLPEVAAQEGELLELLGGRPHGIGRAYPIGEAAAHEALIGHGRMEVRMGLLELLIVIIALLWLFGYFGRGRWYATGPSVSTGTSWYGGNWIHLLLVLIVVLIVLRLLGLF